MNDLDGQPGEEPLNHTMLYAVFIIGFHEYSFTKTLDSLGFSKMEKKKKHLKNPIINE